LRLKPLDIAVFAAYMLMLIGIGVYFTRQPKGLRSYLLADQNIHWIIVAVSVLAALFSGITYLGAPGETYARDLTYIWVLVSFFIATPVTTLLFLPFFRNLNLYTAYEYLERRFDRRPTILVCFVNQVLYPDVADYHLIFRVQEARHGLVFSNDLEIHLIELPKFVKTAEELSGTLDRWLYFLRHGAGLDLDDLPATLDVPEIRRAIEVLMKFTQDELDRAAYEARLKANWDQNSLLREVREAREAAREAREAAQQVLEKGSLIGQILLCQKLLKQPQTPQAELSALSLEELTALQAQLSQQVLPNGG